jgi:iron complex outermembrane recepter protein
VALALVCAGLSWRAMRATEPDAYTLHIASQPLEDALQEFARQTGFEIIVFSSLTDGQRAPALDGRYTVDEALKALLSDSMLTFHRVNAKTIAITLLRRRTDHAIGFERVPEHGASVFLGRSSWAM